MLLRGRARGLASRARTVCYGDSIVREERLCWPDPWPGVAAAPTVMNPLPLANSERSPEPDMARPGVWERHTVKVSYRCPACGTPFAKWDRLVAHLKMTEHVIVPVNARRWLKRERLRMKVPDAMLDWKRDAMLVLIPAGASLRWSRLPEHVLPRAAAEEEYRIWRASFPRSE